MKNPSGNTGIKFKFNMAANDVEIQRQKRPFKICNSSRESKKGIACSSLEELKSISCERFMLNPDCRVFLESDGTEVDNEEYFQFLPSQTLFMVTESNEHWVKSADDIPSKFSSFKHMHLSATLRAVRLCVAKDCKE